MYACQSLVFEPKQLRGLRDMFDAAWDELLANHGAEVLAEPQPERRLSEIVFRMYESDPTPETVVEASVLRYSNTNAQRYARFDLVAHPGNP